MGERDVKLDTEGLEAASRALYELGRGQQWPGVFEHEGNAPMPVKHVGTRTAAEVAVTAYLSAAQPLTELENETVRDFLAETESVGCPPEWNEQATTELVVALRKLAGS